MKELLTTIILAFALVSVGCKGKESTDEEIVQKPKVPVEITTIGSGFVSDNLELFATTTYLNRHTIMAPIPSYITRVYIKIGDRVRKGQLLYELESKERRALGNIPIKYDSSLVGYGRIKVRASGPGIISAIDRQQAGDYVLEGMSLCTIAQNNGMALFFWIPKVETLKPIYSGFSFKPDLNVVKGNHTGVLYFYGYINVPKDGQYTFYLESNTKAFLRIHDAQLIAMKILVM